MLRQNSSKIITCSHVDARMSTNSKSGAYCMDTALTSSHTDRHTYRWDQSPKCQHSTHMNVLFRSFGDKG